MSAIRVLMTHELREALRNRWLLGYGAIFAALALGLALVGLRLGGAVGLDGYGRTTASLLNLCLSLVPLIALLLGSVGLSGDRETGRLELFLAQPLERGHLLMGRFLGALAGIGLATLLGFGIAGVLIGLATGAGGGLQYLAFLGIALALAAVFLAVGSAVAVLVRNRIQAIAAALAIWFGCVVVFDLALIAAGTIAGAGIQVLTAGMLLNPVQVARLLALLVLDPSLEVLGPIGGFLVSRLGPTGAGALLLGALAAWVGGPLVLALARFDSTDPLV
ncbi:MAG: ABC transporter permease [Armatimonadota bacterium]|nr:ABC transporter permease [Armatimonadota bacterium]